MSAPPTIRSDGLSRLSVEIPNVAKLKIDPSGLPLKGSRGNVVGRAVNFRVENGGVVADLEYAAPPPPPPPPPPPNLDE